MNFRDMLKTNEEIQNINDNGLSTLIPVTLGLIAQVHTWHLIIKSGQKHTALNELYTTLQEEVDGLSEKYIAQGGFLEQISINLDVDVSEDNILNHIDAYRDTLSSNIANLKDVPELASILDGVIDLQECIDTFVYKFKLD